MRGNVLNSNMMTSCIGIQQSLTTAASTATNRDDYRPNDYTGKNFYEGQNYRAALQRLEGNYEIAQDLIELMEDFSELYSSYSRALLTLNEKWLKRLARQDTLSSYNTTKRATIDTIKITKKLSAIEQQRIQNIQQVIAKYKKIVNDSFVVTRLKHQHRRTKEFKKQFKDAWSSLNECQIQLDNLKLEQIKAVADLKKK